MEKVSKDMIIGDIIAADNGVIPILMQAGLHCVGCPSAQMESLEQARAVHGVDVNKLVNDINDYLALM